MLPRGPGNRLNAHDLLCCPLDNSHVAHVVHCIVYLVRCRVCAACECCGEGKKHGMCCMLGLLRASPHMCAHVCSRYSLWRIDSHAAVWPAHRPHAAITTRPSVARSLSQQYSHRTSARLIRRVQLCYLVKTGLVTMVKFAHAIDAMKLKELSTSQSVRLQRSACLSSAAHVVDQSINQSVKQSINSNQSNRSIKQPIT